MLFRRKKHHEVRCPDGSRRYVPYDVNDAFPLELREAERRTKARFEVMKQVSAEFEQSHAERIQAGLDGIRKTNDTMIVNLRALYLAYMNDPCGMSEYYATEVRKLVDDHQRSNDRLMRLDTLLNMAKLSGKPTLEVWGLILRAIGELPGVASDEATSAIAASRKDADIWLDGSKKNNDEGQSR
jgi:hypothetical protein